MWQKLTYLYDASGLVLHFVVLHVRIVLKFLSRLTFLCDKMVK